MSQTTKPQLAACSAVFETAELAETIFLELPMRDLLVNVQRTCKQWKAVLDGSRKLQQAMFFEPISDQREQLGVSYQHPEVRVVAHPLVQDLHQRGAHERYKYSRPTAAQHPNASWRRQLVSQPPAARVETGILSKECGYKDNIRSKVHATKTGVTWAHMEESIADNFRPHMMLITGQAHWRFYDLEEGPTYGDLAALRETKDFRRWTSRSEEGENCR